MRVFFSIYAKETLGDGVWLWFDLEQVPNKGEDVMVENFLKESDYKQLNTPRADYAIIEDKMLCKDEKGFYYSYILKIIE